MTTTTTAATTKEVKNIKFKVSQAKKELVITIPLAEYELSKMVASDLSKEELTKNGNYLVASTRTWESITLEGFEHIGFNLSATAKKKVIDEKKRAIESAKVAKEIVSEQSKKVPAMDIDMDEFEEFLEYKKWKAMMKKAKK